MPRRSALSALGSAFRSISGVAFVAGIGFLAFNVTANAQISFQSGSYSATAGLTPPITDNESASGYGGGNAIATDGMSGSLTEVDYLATGFTYLFTQTITDPDATSGSAGATFEALSNVGFTIVDNSPTLVDTEYEYVNADSTLYDLTTGTTLYDTYGGGSLTGMLTAGDDYEFNSNASMQTETDPTLGYAPSITFGPSGPMPTPEPSSLLLLGTGVLGAVGVLRRRFV